VKRGEYRKRGSKKSSKKGREAAAKEGRKKKKKKTMILSYRKFRRGLNNKSFMSGGGKALKTTIHSEAPNDPLREDVTSRARFEGYRREVGSVRKENIKERRSKNRCNESEVNQETKLPTGTPRGEGGRDVKGQAARLK